MILLILYNVLMIVGVDMNVVPAWKLSTGFNICIAIVDDGLHVCDTYLFSSGSLF